MREKIRARCPLCGLMANEENFRKDHYPIEVYLQTFGGKIKGMGKGKGSGRGSSPGMMNYKNITQTPEGKKIIKKIKDLI